MASHIDIIKKEGILALPSLSDQQAQHLAAEQSASTVQDSATPLRDWVCHCTHSNTPDTLASPNGPCQTCTTPAYDAECADVIVTPRDNPECLGLACWDCNYFWEWPDCKDGESVQNGVLSCNVCGHLEEYKVVFVKDRFEEMKMLELEAEQKKEQLRLFDELRRTRAENKSWMIVE
ncbi:hypothetical protein ACET3X_009379 [Alternaria dauci]|uniref:Uncharacterized protein n=1 Tax=Alternaria dauci TaxID=48095 RepID=A0ABR3U9S7_9PLEO